MEQAFLSLTFDHPFWVNFLQYLSTRDKVSLRGVNRNCRDVVDSFFSKAVTLTVPMDMPPMLVRTMVRNNKCVRTLTAEHRKTVEVCCKTVDEIVPFFKYQVRLMSVDLSRSLFSSVKLAFDILVDHCRLLKKICLSCLHENMQPLAVRSDDWPFLGLLRNPLPCLQQLDISGNGSRGLSPTMFASLLEKHPRLHTLSVDSEVQVSLILAIRQNRQICDVMEREGVFREFDGIIQNGVGHLVSGQTDLDQVLEAWLASPNLTHLTLCMGGLNTRFQHEWILSKLLNYLPWAKQSLNLLQRFPVSAATEWVLQCSKGQRAEGEDVSSSPHQPEVHVNKCWKRVHNYTLDAFKDRVKEREAHCSCQKKLATV
ncbi:uncharacterized protein LOC143280170 [Babylonia areolata]|uniref:uncharacterized protein LOC143280170 n=1 Tax=Babylonia areolata TaxID=304850 RepID=UPI003FD5C89A